MGFPLLRLGYEIRWCFAVAHAPQSQAMAVAAAAASPQPASGNQQPLKRWKKEYVCRTKLKKPEKSQFYQGFRSDLRPFLGVPFLRFGYEIRWCFTVAHAPQSHALAVAAAAASPQPASSNQQPLKRWKKEYVCRTKLKKPEKSQFY